MNSENKENVFNYQLLKRKPSVCSTSLHFSKLKEHYHVFAHAQEFDFRTGGPFSSPEPTILLACGRNRELWEQPFWKNKGNNRILPIWFNSVFIYGACPKWLLPELSIPSAGQKDRRLWGRECRGSRIQRCGNWHRAFTNPFASSSINFGFALKLLRIKDQWYTVLVKCNLSVIDSFRC